MNVVVAIDSFKGSLSSLEAGEAAKRGILSAIGDVRKCDALDSVSNVNVFVRPIADGGEGTVEALTLGMGGSFCNVTVTGPLGEKVLARYGNIESKKLAIIEMASASGITLVDINKRNPLYTTTFGVGEMILDAIDKGARRFIVGIGGSATNDGGVGMLKALGFSFKDSFGNEIPLGAVGLRDLASIDLTGADSRLSECSFLVACDVTNPLCGEMGCSAVYGPQKGATSEMIKDMDTWLLNYGKIASETVNSKEPASESVINLYDIPGSGAAGGLGFAFNAFLNARLQPGIDIVLTETHLEDYIKDADYVVTGEGRLDLQTVMGKAPCGVAAIAKKYDKPVIAFSGCVTKDAEVVNAHGIDAFFPILREVGSLEDALNPLNASLNLEKTACQVFRLLGVKN